MIISTFNVACENILLMDRKTGDVLGNVCLDNFNVCCLINLISLYAHFIVETNEAHAFIYNVFHVTVRT
jgi:hypothetical protein